MPLESLRQPFDPEQAGHKLREVQIEEEPQATLLTARERFQWLTDPEKRPIREGIQSINVRTGATELIKDPHDITYDFIDAATFEVAGVYTKEKKQKTLEIFRTRGFFGSVEAKLARTYFVKRVDPEVGKGLQDFIKPEFYQDNKGRWIYSESDRGMETIFSSTQLWMLAIESLQNPAAARETFFQLQQPDRELYNQEKKVWYLMGHPGSVRAEVRCTDQLLGVLVQASFDPEGAREQYEYLRKTDFYDTTDNVWISFLEDDLSLPRNLIRATAKDQFLDVLILSALEKAGVLNPVAPSAPIKLPEERNF